MNEEQQKSFYLRVAKALTAARQQRNMSVGSLVLASGQQHKTISSIESGKPFYFYHAVWIKEILGIDLNEIASSTEEMSNEQETNVEKTEKEFTLDDLI